MAENTSYAWWADFYTKHEAVEFVRDMLRGNPKSRYVVLTGATAPRYHVFEMFVNMIDVNATEG